MSLLLHATLCGSILFAIVFGLDRLCCNGMSAPGRRWWWWLVPAAFLIPVHFMVSVPAPALAALGFAAHPQVQAVASATRAAPDLVRPADAHGASKGAWLTWTWLAGAVIYLALLLWRTIRTTCRWSQERLSTDAQLLELLEDCKAEVGMTLPIGLIVSPSVPGPALLGWLHPRILVPAQLVESSPRRQLRAVLLHELTHLRSFDVQLNWLFSLVCAVHWFNPFAHLTFAAWRQFQEEAADESTIARMNDPSGQAYGEAMLHTLAQCSGEEVPFGALCLVEPLHYLKRRFHLINQYAQKTSHYLLASAVALLLVAAIAVRPVRAVPFVLQDAPETLAALAQHWLTDWDESNYTACWNGFCPAGNCGSCELPGIILLRRPSGLLVSGITCPLRTEPYKTNLRSNLRSAV